MAALRRAVCGPIHSMLTAGSCLAARISSWIAASSFFSLVVSATGLGSVVAMGVLITRSSGFVSWPTGITGVGGISGPAGTTWPDMLTSFGVLRTTGVLGTIGSGL